MAGGSDAFSVFDQLTAARAAMDVNDDGIKLEAGVDPVRVQREAKRREELGQLRARERAGRRQKGMMKQIFG